MAGRVEISFLRDGSAVPDFNLAERISISSISKTGPVAQGQMPWNCDARARVHKRRAFDLRLKEAQPKKSPRIKRLWRPLAENEPTELPKSAHCAFARIPG